MTDITFSIKDAGITSGGYGCIEITATNVDEDEILGQIDEDKIVDYIIDADKDQVLSRLEEDDMVRHISADTAKDHFSDELYTEEEMFNRLSWEQIRDHFSDHIDAEVTDRLNELKDD